MDEQLKKLQYWSHSNADFSENDKVDKLTVHLVASRHAVSSGNAGSVDKGSVDTGGFRSRVTQDLSSTTGVGVKVCNRAVV